MGRSENDNELSVDAFKVCTDSPHLETARLWFGIWVQRVWFPVDFEHNYGRSSGFGSSTAFRSWSSRFAHDLDLSVPYDVNQLGSEGEAQILNVVVVFVFEFDGRQ